MSDLDDKLYNIWFDYWGNTRPAENIEAVKRIKQAFADAGYQKLTGLDKLAVTDARIRRKNRIHVATGETWYRYFQDEFQKYAVYLNDSSLPERSVVKVDSVFWAARKASGLQP